jgi:very-short-patch-repair endonuclease
LAERYAELPLARARSDAESRALELLGPGPQLNVRINAEEADLVWPEQRLILEIDGPQYHLFSDEDARKEAAWRAAGYTVRRVSSDDVFSR